MRSPMRVGLGLVFFLTGLDPFVEHMLNIVLIWVYLDSIRVFGLLPFQVGFIPNGCP